MPDWDADLETGIRFWRAQFTDSMDARNIARGRLLMDSLVTETDDRYDVVVEPCDESAGHWHRPINPTSDAILMYLHGGGYAFHTCISRRFASMLAHHTGACLYAPDYRLTPEHPHPAQAEDALAAWRSLTAQTSPRKIVLVGDSAGGHMALMLLQSLKAADLPQPALCIGLCPWTDVGSRGDSLASNNPYDLVQGWMALKFGEWLDPHGEFGREALSPIFHNFAGLCPIYLQAGGREVLRDMIVAFHERQISLGADVSLDVWPDMPHDFQAYDSLKVSSTEALARISAMVRRHVSA
jgi:acetyl esterase/lipase